MNWIEQNWVKNTILSCSSILVSLVIIELILIVFNPSNLSQSSNKPVYFSQDSDYGRLGGAYGNMCEYGWCPNEGIYISKKLWGDEVIYDVKYTIDKARMRVTPFNSENPDNDMVINFFGGSHTFGEGLNDNETLPYFVHKQTNYRTYNFGFHGYGIHNGLYRLPSLPRNNDLNEKVINVILTSSAHGNRSSCELSFTDGHPKYEINKSRKQGEAFVLYRGKCNNKVRSFISKVIYKLNLTKYSQLATLILNYINSYKTSKEKKISLYKAIILEFNRISISRGEKLIVMYQASPPPSDNNIPISLNEKIIEFLKENNISVFNAGLNRNRKYYIHERDRHPSALANKEKAKMLVSYLKSNFDN